jgi:fatty-acyl-CoA synthase
MTFELDWLKKWAQFSPAAIALKEFETGQQYSYGALYYLSCNLASHLVNYFHIRRGDRVAVLATNEMEYVPLFFAIQRAGAIMVPINFRLTGREITHILRDSGSTLLVYQRQFIDVLETVETKALPDEKWPLDGPDSLSGYIHEKMQVFESENILATIRRRQLPWTRPMSAKPEDACMILYTSGTTGAPKGAMLTYGMLHWNSVSTMLRLNIRQDDVSISFAPFFHTGGWNVLLTPFIHHGASTIMLRKFDPDRVLEICEREHATVVFGVPTMLDMMYHSPAFQNTNLSSMRYWIVGGEPMPIELIRIWQEKGVPIRQGFGLTEFGPNVFSLSEEDAIRKIGSIGFPNYYIDTRVVGEDNKDVKPGEIGELLLKGPACTPGYWNNIEATSSAIQNEWLHTGDLVRYDDEGYFYVVGRKKDMFISGAENVYPVEIEQFLSTHPSIREVAVIGVPDPKWGEAGKAYISLKSGHSVTAEDIYNFCQGNLAKYKIPKHFEFMAELPKGDSGKILKRKLREDFVAATAEVKSMVPSTAAASGFAGGFAATAAMPATATTNASNGRSDPMSAIGAMSADTGFRTSSSPPVTFR